MRAALPAMLADIEPLVDCESPSADLAAVARSADVVARLGAGLLGARPERIVLDGRTHLRWRLGDGPRRVLLLGHHDTVWPIGSLATHPFAVTGDVLRGPGCFDMKAGRRDGPARARLASGRSTRPAVTILSRATRSSGRRPPARSSRPRRAARAPRSCSRRRPTAGRSRPRARASRSTEVHVTGRAAHAGLEPERGINATIELAHQVLAVAGARPTPRSARRSRRPCSSAGTTSTPCPRRGEFSVDVRVPARRPSRTGSTPRMRALRPVSTGRASRCTGGPNRPPLPRARRRPRCSRARSALARALGLAPLSAAAVGGGVRRQLHRRRRHARRSTASARSAAARTPTTSTCSSPSCPAGRRWSPRSSPTSRMRRRQDRGLNQSADRVWSAPTMTDALEVATMEDVTDPHSPSTRPPAGRRRGGRRRRPGRRRRGPRDLRARRAARRVPALRRDLAARPEEPAGHHRAAAGADQGGQLRGRGLRRHASSSAPGRLLRRRRPDGARGAAQPHRRGAQASRAAASASRSSCTSARGPCGAGSPRSRGRSTRWSAATPTSTWPSWPPLPAEYLPNFYGGMHDGINGSDETDRLLVHWDLASPAVAAASAGRLAAARRAGRAGRRRELGLTGSADGRPVIGSLRRRHGPGRRARATSRPSAAVRPGRRPAVAAGAA